MKRNVLSFSVVVMVAALVLASTIKAQESKLSEKEKADEPSLEETLDWLKNTLKGSYRSDLTGHEQALQYEGCKVTYTYSSWWKGSSDYTGVAVFDLSTMDPVSVSVSEVFDSVGTRYYRLDLPAYNNKPVIKVSLTGKFPEINVGRASPLSIWETIRNGEHMVSNFFYVTSSREWQKRLEKAFKHAIKLCGGKVAPF